MSWFSLALLGITALTVVTPFRITNNRQKHLPPSDVLSFQRSAVERPPEVPKKITDQSEYGAKQLPLRTAVEAPPDIIGSKSLPLREAVESIPKELSRKVPLRDSVEHRVAPFFGGADQDSIWIERLTPPSLRETRASWNVICHLETEAAYRQEPFALLPQSLPDRKCTHLIYSAATLDPHEFTLVPRDPEYDEIKGGYKAAVGLKQRDPALRVLISISSPDSGRVFREMVHGQECCHNFVNSVLDFLEAYKFDGIEIDWEGATNAEMRMLLRQLQDPLKERDLMLVVAVRPNDPVDAEISEMSDLLIFRSWRVNNWSNVALHPAPISFISEMVDKWIKSGTESDKIILGIPLFGNSYTLKFKNFTDVGAPITGLGFPGKYTRHRGTLAYYEICEKIEDGWLYGRDEEGSYIKYGDQWIGYDDPISVKLKMAFIEKKQLGGVSLWALDLDDFQGLCGTAWPLLTAATKGFELYDMSVRKCYEEGLFSDPNDCSGFLSCDNGELSRGSCGFGRFFDAVTGLCVKASPQICVPGQSLRISQPNLEYERFRESEEVESLEMKKDGSLVVCYVTSWALYRKGEGKFVPEHIDPRLCTDVVYAFAGLNPETLNIQSFDPWADIENNLYQRVTSVKGPRVLLAIGGWTDSSGDKYSRLVSSGTSRRKFVAAAISFLRRHNFNGLSFEWNYPRCWQSNCKRGMESDKPNFTKLIKELRNEFDKQVPKLTLAVSISGYKEVIDNAYNVDQISDLVDFMSVMTYDYHGAWESRTGHVAPLFRQRGDKYIHYNVNYTMEYLVSLGAARSKLLVGIPFYGQAYRLSEPSQSSLGDPASGPGTSGEFTRQPGMLAYYEICYRLQNQMWKIGPGPNAHYKDQWVGFDDIDNIKMKGEYIRDNGFGGATAWTIDLDDFTNRCCLEQFPLLRSLNRALGRLVTPPPADGSCEKPAEPVTPSPPTLTTHSDANDGKPQPTRPIEFSTTTTTKKPTTWPTWTQHTSRKPQVTTQSSTTTTTSTTTTRQPEITTQSTTLRPSTAYPITDTEELTPGVSAPIPGTECTPGQYLPDPKNCATYYRCVLGELKMEQCAPGLHWHATRGFCDWPNSARCRLLSTTTVKPWFPSKRPVHMTPATTEWNINTEEPKVPTTTTSTTTQRTTTTTTTQRTTTTSQKPTESSPQTELPEVMERCEHGQYYSEPDSCSHFLICVNGVLINQQCGLGLNWHKDKNMCDWAYKNPCKVGNKKYAALVQNKAGNACVPGAFSAVPGDCESYQTCLWGQPEIFQCAPGLHFSEQSGTCDWPFKANCKAEVEPADQAPTQVGDLPDKPTSKPIWTGSTPNELWTQITTPSTTPLPSAEVDPGKVSPLSGYYKIVCYFTNWAWYRRGAGRYLPEHIDHTLCTHIVYGFAVLDYSNLVIKAHDSWADFDNRFYERVVAYKQRGLKVSLALGGWNDSEGDKYSRLVNSPASREKFVMHVVQFVEKYGFDGLDLDWEYPVCWQVDCKKGPASDKAGFSALVEELSSALRPKGLLLTAAVSPNKKVIDAGYDVPVLAKYLDWIAIMTYDYHGQWDKKTGHASPLHYHPDDEFYFFNANYSVNYWISKGAPPRSLVMGMPLYGQSFSINDPKAGVSLNAPASAGNAGEFTRAAGFLSYYEICDRIHNRGWTVVQDPERRIGPYAYKGNQWVSFDDADMLRQKSQFIRDMNLGGGMVWALDLDDFRGKCGEGPHPLMHTIQQVLTDPPNEHDRPIQPPAFGEELQWEIPTEATDIAKPNTPSVSSEQIQATNDDFKVVCYFTNWAWYRQETGKYLPEDIDPDLCTHIIYGFAVLDTTSLTIKPHDSWADLDNKFYERVVAFRSRRIKVLLALGGWNDSAGDKYSRLANSAAARKRFITHAVQFVEKYGFDGLDLDWEYPVCWQVDCGKGPDSDKEGFSALLEELSAEFKPKGLLLSSAVSPNKRVIDAGYDVPVLAKYLDWIAVMSYDYHGQWDKKTGHNAPFYERPDDWEPTFNANFSIHYWMAKGAPAKKLVMGVPFYGQSFSLAESKERGLNVPTYGGGEAGEGTRARGFLSYYEICARTQQKGWTVVQDPLRRIGPYAYKGDQWVSFDDAQQIQLKAEFMKNLGLGGGMVWALDLDDFKNKCGCEPYPMLRTLNRVLRNYPDGPLCSITEFIETEEPPSVTLSPMKPSSTPSYEPPRPTKPSYKPPQWTKPSTTSQPDYMSTTEIDDTIEIEVISVPDSRPPTGDCQGQMYLPHERDCSKYYLCNFGQITEQICAGGLHWNKDHCDWPENSECKKKQQSSTIESNIPGGAEAPAVTPSAPIPVISSEKPSNVPEVPIVVDRPNSGQKKMVCYFTNWAWYRPGVGKYVPEDIDTSLCTHIVYGFAVLDTEELKIKTHDSWADIDNEFYRKVTSLKARGIKVLIAIGGWNDSAGDKYSRLVNNPDARRKFIINVLKFIEKYDFDGLDLDWEYPVCWQVDCNLGPSSDKESFAAFLQELSDEFRPKGLLLSAAVSASKRVIDYGYDVPALAEYLDWIAVMTYDYHGHWERKTGHVAPLYYYPGDEFDYFNANYSMNYWITKGAPPSSLVMGVPLYGQSFTLTSVSSRGLQAAASGPGQAGEFTRAGGFLAYYEICHNVKNGRWTVVKDSKGRLGPYATSGDQWVGYDDIAEVTRKANLIRDLDLGGGMVWALDLDDFTNRCGCGKYPLLTALNRALQGDADQAIDCV